jgi:lipopolysaccharide export system permease protein
MVLLVIFMSNKFAEILGDAAANTLPKEAVFEVLRLTFLQYVTLLAPIGLLLGLMLALARLNRDAEMAALAACGVGPGKLLRPIALIATVAVVGVAWLALVETPRAARRIEAIEYAARQTIELEAIQSGRFTSMDSGRTVLYAREVQGNQLRGVFYERERDGRVVVITADRGERVQDADSGELMFRLYDGRRTEGTPGEGDFLIAEFGEHGSPIRSERREEPVESATTRATSELVGSSDPADRAEFQWRLSTPISIAVLALLALPLSRSSPREGRYARVGIGLLIYIIYENSLSVARIWVERSQVPEWLGMWWVHAVVMAFAVVMLLRFSGALVRVRPFSYDAKKRREPVT